ncbi:MAG: Na/Pi cotransporter family protein [Elusimicrobia bacterium]|nr:Na/Pi cotransporter family protein [Elusimicrobiota bacterium]
MFRNFLKLLTLITVFFIYASPAIAASREVTLIKISGNAQVGIRGYPLKDYFVVRALTLSGEAAANVRVNFDVIPSRYGNREIANGFVSPNVVYTDSYGFAYARFELASNTADEIIVLAYSDAAARNLVFAVTAFSRNWVAIMIANLAGGLALLFFGMFYINNALQKVAGQKIRNILASLTSSKTKSLGTGFFVTFLNQSSTATILLAISFVSAGMLSFYQSMGITLGAAVGSTMMGQLVAFRLIDYALLIIGIGYFVSFFGINKKVSQIADALFGFGLLFYGMKLTTVAMVPVTLNPVFLDFIAQMRSPLLGIGVGIVITLLMQSSGAVVGLVIALASTQVLTLHQAIYLCLGSQIGTCITVVIATLKQTRAARRTMIWQIIHQTASVIIIFPFLALITINGEGVWIVFVKWVTQNIFMSTDVSRQIAMSHTFVAVITAAAFLPLIKPMQKFVMFIYPFKESEIMFNTIYITPSALSEPQKALALARKEMLRIAEFTLAFVKQSVDLIKAKDTQAIDRAIFDGAQIGALIKETVPYLAKLGQQELKQEQSEEEIKLLYIASDLDEIANVISRNIVPAAQKKVRHNLRFSDEGIADLKKMHNAVYTSLYKVVEALNTGDASAGKQAMQSKQSVRALESELRKRHIARLHADLKESIETSGLHMDILDQYARINSLAADIGKILSEPIQ